MNSVPPPSARRDEDSAAWFDGLAEGHLLIRECAQCGHYSRPDSATCPQCHSDELSWRVSSGHGTVVSAIVDHRTREPITLGLVELDEGPWLHVRLVEVPRTSVGARVTFSVSRPEGSEPIPEFVGTP